MIDIDKIKLRHGKHKSPEDGMCAAELASYLAGEKFSDSPQCVCPTIASFLRTWNDGIVGDDLRTKLLKDIVPMALNTNDGNSSQRSILAYEWVVRKYVPAFLELVPELRGHAEKLRKVDLVGAPAQLGLAAQAAWQASRQAAGQAAWQATWQAAGEALAPTVADLQSSARKLLIGCVSYEPRGVRSESEDVSAASAVHRTRGRDGLEPRAQARRLTRRGTD